MQLPLQLNCIYGFALLFNFAHAIWTPFVLFVYPHLLLDCSTYAHRAPSRRN